MENHRISFDRIAGIYDETRGHPPEVSSHIAEVVRAKLPQNAFILEVGVGTGRIVRPLLKSETKVFGIDISSRMMARFREMVVPIDSQPYLSQADALNLPLRTHAFQAVLSIHIFHLIKDWQQALDEMIRVLRPDGYLCIGYDWRDPNSPHSQINEQWRQIVSRYVENAHHPGLRNSRYLLQTLNNRGMNMEEIEAASWEYIFIPARYIQQIADGTYSYSWKLDPNLIPVCINELKTWTIEQFGLLDTEFSLPKKFIWQIYHRLNPIHN
jgi:ubiquinone/menaquinone biosynthesis C-methylase UbiE